MTTSALVPAVLPFAIHGHPYLIDPNYERTTVQVMRQQADTSTEAGEQSLTPLGLWRRSQESWHHGAGQGFLDGRQGDEPTDPHRFRSSKGVDVWTKGQASLLHPTLKIFASANTNLYLAVATPNATDPTLLYVSAGTEVYSTSTPSDLLGSYASQQGTGWTATNASKAAQGNGMRITATSSAAVSVTSPTGLSGMAVDPEREYAFVFESANVSGSGGKTPRAFLNWYDITGTFISSSATVTASGPDTVAADVIGSAVAPSNARFMSITGQWTANWTNGDVHDAFASIAPADIVALVPFSDVWRTDTVNAGQAAQSVQSLASNGTYVWAALGTSGLHRILGTSATADVPAAPASGQISLVGWANGFLLAAGSAGVSSSRQNSLWLVSGPLDVSPTLVLIKTHPDVGFVWTGISPGRNCVYAYGNSGGNGEVYKVLFDPNTGILSSAASFATYLPDGETIHALQFYAGAIIMGTGKGIRIGTADGAGNIDYGPLVPTPFPVRCLEPQDRYCWFGWTSYDSSTSGLGRIDLGFFTDTLTPAWASDLMTVDPTEEATVACVTFSPIGYSSEQRPPIRVFTVAGQGVYAEDPGSRVIDGRLVTGRIRFSTSEPKTARSLDVRHHALPDGAQILSYVEFDSDGDPTGAGDSTTAGSYGPPAPFDLFFASQAEAMEFSFTLTRPDPNLGDYTRSPELTRWTAKVLPNPSTIDEAFTVTIRMRSLVDTTAADGQPYPVNVPAEVAFLKSLERSREIVEMQLGDETHDVYVLSSKFTGDHWNSPLREFAEGDLELICQTARG